MSYRVFFDFAAGLSASLQVPRGTQATILAHVAEVERTLGLVCTTYNDQPGHWDRWKRDWSQISDKTLCETVSRHNAWVRWLYDRLAHWSHHPVVDGEELSPDDAKAFWHALEQLDVPPERWTGAYYKERMDCLYAVMRGRETEGITFDTKALTPRQAAAVMTLFAEFLDTGDIRLDVPKGHDSPRLVR